MPHRDARLFRSWSLLRCQGLGPQHCMVGDGVHRPSVSARCTLFSLGAGRDFSLAHPTQGFHRIFMPRAHTTSRARMQDCTSRLAPPLTHTHTQRTPRCGPLGPIIVSTAPRTGSVCPSLAEYVRPDMARHLLPSKLDYIFNMQRAGHRPIRIHAELSRLRVSRGLAAPTLVGAGCQDLLNPGLVPNLFCRNSNFWNKWHGPRRPLCAAGAEAMGVVSRLES